MSEFEPPKADEPSADPPTPPAAPAAPAAPAEPQATEAPASAPGSPHPIQLIVTDDLQRSRLTVFLRSLLAIPHLIWLVLWGIAAYIAIVIAWFAALITGQVPAGLHDFIARYVRYTTHVYAYVTIAANPFPAFGGTTPYPIDLQIAPPVTQSRLTVFFRVLLVIPIAIVVGILGYLIWIAVLLAWLIGLVLGRIPQGIENMLTFYLRLNARYMAYVALLTPKYPSFD